MKTSPRITALVLSVVAITCVASGAVAFSVQNAYMDSTHKTVSRWATTHLTYYVDNRAIDGVSATQSQQDMKGSFQDWEDVDCSALTFQFLGNSSSQDVLPITGTINGKNELVWVTGSTECRKWTFGESVLGVTLPMQDYYTGEIYESDIAFNNCDYKGKWAVNQNDLGWGEISFKSVAIHEIGHFFGQQHSCLDWSEYNENDPATMAPYVDYYGMGDTLNSDDELGACFLYPDQDYYSANKGLYKCGSSANCPRIVTHDDNGKEVYDYDNFSNGRLQCAGGYCIGLYGTQPGTSLLGVICQNPVACDGGICMDIGDGRPRCTNECSLTNDQCPSGYHCDTVDGQDVCVIGQVAGGVGSKCTYTSDCEGSMVVCFSAPDGSRTCRVKCNTDAGCKANEYCWEGNSYGGCFPDPVVVLKGTGEFCTASDQCKSGLCVTGDDGMRCRVGCQTSDTCTDGYACDDVSKSCLPAEEPVEPTLEIGDECAFAVDCKSGICLPGTDGRRCRQECGTGDSCPDGWVCDRSTADAACLPETGTPELLAEGEVCAENGDCTSGLCFAATSGDTRRCRVECDLEDWFCPTEGTACVGYDTVASGVCMPTDDRGDTGDTCGAPADCISGICLGASDAMYCSQSCVDDWCPDGFACKAVGAAGDFCIRDSGTGDDGSAGCSGSNGNGGGLLPVIILVFAAFVGFRRRASVQA